MKNKIFKSILFLTFIFSCSFCKTAKENLMPGQCSSDLHDLSPRFKSKVEKLIINLTQNGYSIRVSQTFRDQERQQFLHDVSIKMKKFLGKDIKITTTKSRHSHKIDGKPAACAIDIRPNHVYLPGSQVEFYN